MASDSFTSWLKPMYSTREAKLTSSLLAAQTLQAVTLGSWFAMASAIWRKLYIARYCKIQTKKTENGRFWPSRMENLATLHQM